jgi:hypothetical protein
VRDLETCPDWWPQALWTLVKRHPTGSDEHTAQLLAALFLFHTAIRSKESQGEMHMLALSKMSESLEAFGAVVQQNRVAGNAEE